MPLDAATYARLYDQSLRDPEGFWREAARRLDWMRFPERIKDTSFDAADFHVRWYADGAPLAPEPGTGRVVWRPPAAGFYRLTVVDAQGRAVDAKVRVRADAAH